MIIRHILPQPEMGVLPFNPLDAPLAGLVNSTLQLAIQQARDGHDVEIFCPTEEKKIRRQKVSGVRVNWIPIWKRWRLPRYDWSYLLPLYFLTKKSRPVDITHVHSNPYLIVNPKSRATVLHYHNPAVKQSPMYDRAISKASAIICVSDYIRKQVLKTLNYPGEKIIAVHNGINCEEFIGVNRAQVRASFNVKDDQVVILWAGRVIPDKGLLILVEALRRVVQSGYTKAVLFVAGSAKLGAPSNMSDVAFNNKWPEFAAYEKAVVECSHDLPIRFVGNLNRSNMLFLYRMGDIFVWPSIYDEPFARVIIEAIASGLPVIASNTGGNPEAVIDNQNGILVPTGDPVALAEALKVLISSQDLRHRLGQGSQHIARKWDWPVVSKLVEQIYSSLLFGPNK